ncbi:MAG TPA: thermosome subunit alpha [Methanotrichaceae archaeon]|nr:thermosome subunit alpha [Methanotrichaceae archaeon]
MAGLSGTPVILLKEGSKRETGKDAQKKNIMAARAVADAVRTTLGPRGMDKMLIDGTGDATITNDGATILREMDIEHPVAKMIVEVAKAQDDEIGDGTTTAVVIAGELLKNAESLIDQGVHPTVIVLGYKLAQARAQEILSSMAVDISGNNRDILMKIAQTAMTGKGIQIFIDKLSGIAVDAAVAVSDNKRPDVDENIKIVKITGGSLEDSEINYGIVVEKERLNPEMPKRVENANIVLLEGTLELKKLSNDAKISITKADELQSFKQNEEEVLKAQVEALANAGANVVFCQKGIGNTASHFLAKYGILAARRVKDEEMKMLALATGARIIGDASEVTDKDLGHCKSVEERKVGKDEHMIFVEGCTSAKAVSVILHGVSEQFLEEVERAMNDALHVVLDALQSGKIVPGGGAPEIEVAEKIRVYASTLSGRDQLAVMAFANAVESIPKILAENAGFDPVDVLVAVRSKHGQGMKNTGVDLITGKPADMLKLGVVEPLKVKTQALKSATEAATMVLRVDDVIASKVEGLKPKPGQSPHDYTRPF